MLYEQVAKNSAPKLANLPAPSTLPQIKGHESLPDGECWVVCRSIMAPVFRGFPVTQTVTLTDHPQTVTIPIDPKTGIAQRFDAPAGTVAFRFSETDPTRALHGMFLGAKRVRNYIAFLAGLPVPIRYVMASRRFLMPMVYKLDDPMRYHPEVRSLDDAEVERWYRAFSEVYPRAERMLAELDPMSPMGRAVSLVGDAFWTEDVEESFLYAWRAVDVVAKRDYTEARRLIGDSREFAMRAYFPKPVDASGCVSPERGPSDSTKILVSVEKRVPGVAADRVREFNELRGMVAHDTVDVDQFKRVLYARWEAIAVARSMVSSVLAGAVPSMAGWSPPEFPQAGP